MRNRMNALLGDLFATPERAFWLERGRSAGVPIIAAPFLLVPAPVLGAAQGGLHCSEGPRPQRSGMSPPIDDLTCASATTTPVAHSPSIAPLS